MAPQAKNKEKNELVKPVNYTLYNQKITFEFLKAHLWSAADILKGSLDPADYRQPVMTLLFLKSLNDTFEENAEKLIKRTPPFSDSGIPHLRSNNIRDGKLNFEDLTFVSERTYEEYMTRGIPKENDVLFTTEGPLGEVALVPKDFKFSIAQRIIVLRPKLGRILPQFLKYLLLDRKVRIRCFALATGTTLGGIASKWFTKILLPYPKDIMEQRNIANYLDQIEKQIDYDENLLFRYKNLKNGLMQKLLTGKLRVKV